ncbi:Cytochrome P450 [Naviculisporaceae sp. PSN 640]
MAPEKINQASLLDDGRVLAGLIAPTIAKGTIKRRPAVESLAQHHGLDTSALQLLQDLRHKYGSSPLLVSILFRSQVLILNSEDAVQVLQETPEFFTSASKEKKSALRHFEPGNVLIADDEMRDRLRPVHEEALATGEKIHPFAGRMRTVVDQELRAWGDENGASGQKGEVEMDWDMFGKIWSRIILRIALGDSARDDEELVATLNDIRQKGNWGFMAFTDDGKLEEYREQPGSDDLDLPSQVAQWLFAFDAAALATFRAMALLASHPEHQETARKEADNGDVDLPFLRSVFLESVRLWPTSPAILRELKEDHQIGGKLVEKGTGVVIFTPFFHRDDENEKLGKGVAHKICPEQWKDKAEVVVEKGLFPFSFGPAMCPAHHLVPLVASLVMGGMVGRGREGGVGLDMELVKPELDVGSLPGTLDNFEVVLRVKKDQAKGSA